MKIKEVKCGFMGIASEIEIIIMPFATDAKQCNVQYIIKNPSEEVINRGTYTLANEEFENWGSDNTHVEDCVLNSLGLKRL